MYDSIFCVMYYFVTQCINGEDLNIPETMASLKILTMIALLHKINTSSLFNKRSVRHLRIILHPVYSSEIQIDITTIIRETR